MDKRSPDRLDKRLTDQPAKVLKAINNRQLNIYNFHDDKNVFLNTLYSQMKTVIGSGGVGKVYLVQNGKYVVKESAPCYYDLPQLVPYCNDIKELLENKPMTLIPSGKKYKYLLPNLLSEAVIGMIFEETQVSIHVSGVLGSFILLEKDKPSVYNILNTYTPIEKKGILNPIFSKPADYLYLLFQVSTALLNTQERFRFTHYDLHLGNILLDTWKDKNGNSITYKIPNKTISVKKQNCPFISKITDYGLSRFETNSTIVIPNINSYPDASYGEFNPSYDIISFIGSTLFDFRTKNIFYPLLSSNLDFYYIILKFVLWMFNEMEIKITSKTLLEYSRVTLLIGKKYYTSANTNQVYFRPLPFEKNLVKFTNIKSMSEIVTYLSKVLLKFKLAIITEDKNVISYRKWDSIVPFPLTPGIANIETGIRVQTYRTIISAPPNNYNFTLDAKQIASCPIQEHYITAIFVDPKTFGYSFNISGYMLDPINYMRENDIFGFAINGGFFNIGKDYLPIGPYKDEKGIFENTPIPSNYKDVYGYVCFRRNEAIITRDIKLASKYDYFLSTGPFLIENSNIVFRSYEERFACVNPQGIPFPIRKLGETEKEVRLSGYLDYYVEGNACNKKLVNFPLTLPRCDKIAPGELSHADNPNPRSAVCILKNGDIIFLTVEGRGERGVGIDLATFAKSILKTFPTVITAINLDGGRSSNMAWRAPASPNTVYISNPNHMYSYPVGNIITFSKPKY